MMASFALSYFRLNTLVSLYLSAMDTSKKLAWMMNSNFAVFNHLCQVLCPMFSNTFNSDLKSSSEGYCCSCCSASNSFELSTKGDSKCAVKYVNALSVSMICVTNVSALPGANGGNGGPPVADCYNKFISKHFLHIE